MKEDMWGSNRNVEKGKCSEKSKYLGRILFLIEQNLIYILNLNVFYSALAGLDEK